MQLTGGFCIFVPVFAMLVQTSLAVTFPTVILKFSTSPATFNPRWCNHDCLGRIVGGNELQSFAAEAFYVPDLYGGAWESRRALAIRGDAGVLSVYFTISGNLEDKFDDVKTLKYVSFQKAGDARISQCYSLC